MSKSILYRLFGIGKIPPTVMAELTSEGIVLFDEGIPGSVTYRNFRSPGRVKAWGRVWFTSSIAVTNVRVLALQYNSPIINVPLTDARLKNMHWSLEKNAAVLVVTFDPNLFHADWSGTIEYRFRTPLAPRLLALLQPPTG